jgi:hypothetical protein
MNSGQLTVMPYCNLSLSSRKRKKISSHNTTAINLAERFDEGVME